MPNINIEIEVVDLSCDEEKVLLLCDKITEAADEVGVNPIEMGAALGKLQDWVFKDYGVLAPTDGVIKFLKEEVEL